MPKCPSCRASYGAKDQFCPECGVRIGKWFYKKTPKWFLVTYAVYVCIIILSFLIHFLEKKGFVHNIPFYGLLGIISFFAFYTFPVFNIFLFFYFLIARYEVKSWVITLIGMLFCLLFSNLYGIMVPS